MPNEIKVTRDSLQKRANSFARLADEWATKAENIDTSSLDARLQQLSDFDDDYSRRSRAVIKGKMKKHNEVRRMAAHYLKKAEDAFADLMEFDAKPAC